MVRAGIKITKKRKNRTISASDPFQDGLKEARIKRMNMLQRVDVVEELLEMFNSDTADFRGGATGTQRKIVEPVMRGDNRIVGIMPTGEGKSLVFILPASCSTKRRIATAGPDHPSGRPGQVSVTEAIRMGSSSSWISGVSGGVNVVVVPLVGFRIETRHAQ